MPDPTVILASLCFIVAAFGFGFMAGQRHEQRRMAFVRRMAERYQRENR